MPLKRKHHLEGQKFNRLTVLEYVGKSRYKCKCDCGNIKTIAKNKLISGETKSCRCFFRERMTEIFKKDLIGKKFNKLLVLECVGKGRNNTVYLYKCRCDCGKEKILAGEDISSNKTKSCGKCNLLHEQYKEIFSEWDFEKNKNINAYLINSHSSKRVWWKCAKCGNSWNTKICDRTNSDTWCPLCCSSKGNKKITKILLTHKINFEKEKKFNDCKNIKILSFDFYLPDYNLCIEYQGGQHYFPVKNWGGEEMFKNLKKRDQIKRTFCQNNNIKLLEIKYTEYSNIENIILNIIQKT